MFLKGETRVWAPYNVGELAATAPTPRALPRGDS